MCNMKTWVEKNTYTMQSLATMVGEMQSQFNTTTMVMDYASCLGEMGVEEKVVLRFI